MTGHTGNLLKGKMKMSEWKSVYMSPLVEFFFRTYGIPFVKGLYKRKAVPGTTSCRLALEVSLGDNGFEVKVPDEFSVRCVYQPLELSIEGKIT